MGSCCSACACRWAEPAQRLLCRQGIPARGCSSRPTANSRGLKASSSPGAKASRAHPLSMAASSFSLALGARSCSLRLSLERAGQAVFHRHCTAHLPARRHLQPCVAPDVAAGWAHRRACVRVVGSLSGGASLMDCSGRLAGAPAPNATCHASRVRLTYVLPRRAPEARQCTSCRRLCHKSTKCCECSSATSSAILPAHSSWPPLIPSFRSLLCSRIAPARASRSEDENVAGPRSRHASVELLRSMLERALTPSESTVQGHKSSCATPRFRPIPSNKAAAP
mmetsp:Transcript_3314/g.13674  ORF Transcript_3314/g.13674 Transcript_3314/m.13674 type:complete len:281 (-) Transcript_3314:984-1826(-)